MGISFPILLGIPTLLCVLAALAFVPGQRKWQSAFAILALAPLLYSARFSLDLLSHTHQHLSSWYTDETYDEMGSVLSISRELRKLPDIKLYVCRDGTNYKEKLLRYHTYPLQLSAEGWMAKQATHVLVMNKLKWKYNPLNQLTPQNLFCGDVAAKAALMQRFADGSELFAIANPS